MFVCIIPVYSIGQKQYRYDTYIYVKSLDFYLQRHISYPWSCCTNYLQIFKFQGFGYFQEDGIQLPGFNSNIPPSRQRVTYKRCYALKIPFTVVHNFANNFHKRISVHTHKIPTPSCYSNFITSNILIFIQISTNWPVANLHISYLDVLEWVGQGRQVGNRSYRLLLHYTPRLQDKDHQWKQIRNLY